MTKSSFAVLNSAQQKILEGDESTALSFYARAHADNVPAAAVALHKVTKGYMLLAMGEYSPVQFFEALKTLKIAAASSEAAKAEYVIALGALLNIHELFLRDIAIHYFCDISVSSWGSPYAKSLDALQHYLYFKMDEITEKDCYEIKRYLPDGNLKKLRRDLKKITAYCLNMLLMYVGIKSTQYTGKTYHATTMDFGDYYLTEVKARDNYSSNASVMTRMHFIQKEAYYDDYLQRFNEICDEIKFSCQTELRKEVTRLVDRKPSGQPDEKDFFKYAKRMEKEDLEQLSYFSLFGRLNPFYFMIKPILKICLGAGEVGSFELDNPFNRKRWLGVCNMIAWANNWSIEMVRVLMLIASCCCVGVFAYIGLFISMKAGTYLPNLSVTKH
ncbi:MAG: hypothetical protein IJD75_01505 [Clostridia bacterium]|nr:hypothetical protein [Clostridia bacterium]